jgi:hypothetical protein
MQAMGQQGFWDVEDRQQKLKQKKVLNVKLLA